MALLPFMAAIFDFQQKSLVDIQIWIDFKQFCSTRNKSNVLFLQF